MTDRTAGFAEVGFPVQSVHARSELTAKFLLRDALLVTITLRHRPSVIDGFHAAWPHGRKLPWNLWVGVNLTVEDQSKLGAEYRQRDADAPLWLGTGHRLDWADEVY